MASPAGLTKMLVILPAVYAMKQINFEDDTNLLYLRIGFGIVQALILLVNVAIYFKINKANNQKKIKVPVQPSWGQQAEGNTEQIMTIKDYDFGEWKKGLLQNLFVAGLLIFLHVKWAVYAPLFIQSVSMPMTIYDTPLFKLHILGRPDEGDLQRPFKPPASPFAGLMPTEPAEEETKEKAEEATKPKTSSNNNKKSQTKKKRHQKAD
jgi:hypothetical protein